MAAGYIVFGDPRPSESGKTQVWPVDSTTGAHLGEVRWFGRWRCYTFHPDPGTVYNEGCLQDIARFCGQQTRRKWGHGA